MVLKQSESTEPTHTDEIRNRIITWTIVSLMLILVLAAMLFLPGKNMAPRGVDEDGNTVDVLFYKLGLLKVPAIEPPMDIHLKDFDGEPVTLSTFEGNIVFLNFWATWCPGCRLEMPAMEKLHQRFRDRDFKMIAVSLQESPDRIRAFFKNYRLSFTGLLDETGTVGARFGAVSIPTTYILNKNGAVIGKAVGARDWYSPDAIALFETLVDTGLDIPFERSDF